MADFNQSPAGQSTVTLSIQSVALTLSAHTDSTDFGATSFDFTGNQTAVDISPSAAPAIIEDFTFYPSYRRPNRLVTGG